MGAIGLSLVVASLILFWLRPPAWFPAFIRNFRQGRLGPPPQTPLIKKKEESGKEKEKKKDSTTVVATRRDDATDKPSNGGKPNGANTSTSRQGREQPVGVVAMPSPPPVVVQPAATELATGSRGGGDSAADDDEAQTTPRASAAMPDGPVPSFSLSSPEEPSNANPPAATPSSSQPKPPAPAPAPTFGLMAPPPRPSAPSLRPPPSPAPSRLPVPNRNPLAPSSSSSSSQSSSLALPPTHSAKPKKPSRQVVLTPGHSPLDWARLSSNPGANLRGLPPNAPPYIRVTPSMLKRQTGRRGTDAWMVLGGRVYNVSPYEKFHPGGVPELLRGAGKDATQLFGEVHPWVNFEGMLSACLIGIYVAEEEAAADNSD
ncbi:hypothetical protein B0T19DRAFT_375823 [Cercophora scortea]|uniref:Cytochrome b5 heme-binding domain-containing protein n=1 Tax=Cercophora scortea TaxID=314031 RepID=A0AAE0I8Q7_9PEZI|nr:hypothetical protein B0T19DRAFT_375823 [Cercophora scortea]